MDKLTGQSISNMLPYIGTTENTKDLMFSLCKWTRDLHLAFRESLYFDVTSTYYFPQDKIYESHWKVENNKATCTYTGCEEDDDPWILISPDIPEGTKAQIRIKKSESSDGWYIGISKEKMKDEVNVIWLGWYWLDWSYQDLGCK